MIELLKGEPWLVMPLVLLALILSAGAIDACAYTSRYALCIEHHSPKECR